MAEIDILIATYKRLNQLEKLLRSLAAQDLKSSLTLRIIVIDNDPLGSAKTVTEQFFLNHALPYLYDIQPEKNISLTRNKAIEHSRAPYLAFIDDDEWADPDWLHRLWETSRQYNADVVFGPVLPCFLSVPPAWAPAHLFEKRGDKTGAKKRYGSTCNALIRVSEQLRNELVFRPEYGLTGGEDTDFFFRLFRKGAKLIWCNEAIVHEAIPIERMTFRWWVRRSFRGGQVLAKITSEGFFWPQKANLFLKRAIILFFHCLLFPFELLTSPLRWRRRLHFIIASIGQLCVLCNSEIYQEYK